MKHTAEDDVQPGMPTDDAAIDDFVFASPDGTLDPNRTWACGYVVGWIKDDNGNKHYLIGPKKRGKAWFNYGLPHVRKVTKSSAGRIVRYLRRARRKPLFDQIWQCLIEEHKKQHA